MAELQKTRWSVVLITLVLYVSGFFVYFTPLPVVYYLLKDKETHFKDVLWPCLITVTLFYSLVLPQLISYFQSDSSTFLMVTVPMVGWLKYVSQTTVMFFGIGYFLLFAAIARLIVLGFETPGEIFRVGFFAIVGMFFASIIFGWVFLFSDFDVIFSALKSDLSQMFDQMIAAQEKSESMSAEALVVLKDQASVIVGQTLKLIPFLFLLYLTFLYVANLIFAKRLFLVHIEKLALKRLTEFRVPFEVVWGLSGFMALLLLNHLLFSSEWLHGIGLNVVLSIALAYFLQGMAVAIVFLDRKNIHGFLRVLVYFLFILNLQFVAVFFVIIGFTDNWWDLRKAQNTDSQAAE